jgi:heme A synthase
MSLNNFARYAWGVLGYNLLVILWGAFVRATGSGAGCGRHWPACNGEVLPRTESLETLIEFSHRITSGIALLSTIVLLVWAFRAYSANHRVRKGALASMALMIVEALLGAGLVLFELVAENASVARGAAMALHLINTFLLIGAITLTAWWASGGGEMRLRSTPIRMRFALGAAFAGMLVLGASGAITALGDTLLLTAGISPADSPLLATLVELRIFHPLIAFAVGALIWLSVYVVQQDHADRRLRRTGYVLLGVYGLQLLIGGGNVILQAPVAMQLIHLFISDVIWILLVLLAAQRLSVSMVEVEPPHLNRAVPQTGD